MLLSLVDIMRCPALHEESALVLAVESWREQRIWSGTLGCPVCHTRYEIRHGAVHFGTAITPDRAALSRRPDEMRLAAQLDLMEPGGVVLLTGRYALANPALTEVANVTCIVIDAEPEIAHEASNFVGVVRLPLASGVLRGAAVDEDRAGPAFLADVLRCLRAGGRLIAPVATPVPQGATIVATDAEEWVAENRGYLPIVQIRH